jgi:putative ABC transport system permease protein
VRFRDLLGLALSALFQQKIRTLLTTLGVVFGSLVLIFSLSVLVGVDDTVEREYGRLGELRKIRVEPKSAPPAKVPPEVATIRGAMSEARRKRLEREARERWLRGQPPKVKQKLTREVIAALQKLEGVRSAQAVLFAPCHALLGKRAERANAWAALPDNDFYRDRVIAGTFLPAADGRDVVVSEYLLYELGVRDDSDLQAVVGKKLRLRYRPGAAGPSLLLALGGDGSQPTVPEADAALGKVLEQLPEAVKTMKLTKEERAAVARLLLQHKGGKAKETTVEVELKVCGVLRLAEDRDRKVLWWGPPLNPDLIVPARSAEALFWKAPQNQARGFDLLTVEVERLEDIKGVSKRIEAMGLRARSLAEFAERERFTYVLIFSAMTVVALVSLLVAALGIVNTMLMSVLERVREIGVMKAVGARDGHIQLIFLVEGALIGLVGGLLGLLLGWAGSFPADAWVRAQVEQGMALKLQESIFSFPWWLVAGTPTFACLVTTLAAYYPARRAARVNPITALRHE